MYPTATRAQSTASLLGQVLGLTAVAFGLTATTCYFGKGLPMGVAVVAMLLPLLLIFALFAARKNEPLALTIFYGIAACEGVGLAPVIQHYLKTVGAGVIVEAAATTALGMAVLGLVAWTSSFDFRKLSGISFALLLGLVIVGMIGLFFHFFTPTIYAWATLAVFTLLVLVDFARIRAGGDGETAIELALGIYLDALNIFLALLQIFGGSSSSKDD